MMNWQPISTAPKDGQVIWLFDKVRFLGAWIDSEFRPVIQSRSLDSYNIFANARDVHPTKWQAIPDAPKDGE